MPWRPWRYGAARFNRAVPHLFAEWRGRDGEGNAWVWMFFLGTRTVWETGGCPTCRGTQSSFDIHSNVASKVRQLLKNGIYHSPRDIFDGTPLRPFIPTLGFGCYNFNFTYFDASI
jgi:hypothetical protein